MPLSLTAPGLTSPGPLLELISRLATDPSVDVGKLQQLLELQERLDRRQAEVAYSEAFAEMQPHLPRIKKDGSIELPSRREGTVKIVKFSSWEAIDREVRPILAQHGFGLTFVIGERSGGGVRVTAKLRHRAGHYEECPAEGPPDAGPGRNALQAYGSTVSYLKRYAAGALLNLVSEGEDDDGAKGGRVPITAEHAREIDALRQEMSVPVESLLALFGVEQILHLSEDNFVPAMNLLKARQRRVAASNGNGDKSHDPAGT